MQFSPQEKLFEMSSSIRNGFSFGAGFDNQEELKKDRKNNNRCLNNKLIRSYLQAMQREQERIVDVLQT